MRLGYIGLGKMGAAMVERLREKGHSIETYDPHSAVATCATVGELIKQLEAPRVVWLMVPHDAVSAVVSELKPLLDASDTIIDGGNSLYTESIIRYDELKKENISFLDVGVSGGPKGAREGACIMVGGDKDIFLKLESLFRDASAEGAFLYAGHAGAGHFVKMVHNGIEYGMMQAIAEGFTLLKSAPYGYDLRAIASLYNHRSVIESRLMGWLENAYAQHGAQIDGISGSAKQSGEGLWTAQTARDLKIDTPVISASVEFRKQSQSKPSYTGQIISALRNQFGGHNVQ